MLCLHEFLYGAQWLSWESVRLGIEGLLIRDTLELLCCNNFRGSGEQAHSFGD